MASKRPPIGRRYPLGAYGQCVGCRGGLRPYDAASISVDGFLLCDGCSQKTGTQLRYLGPAAPPPFPVRDNGVHWYLENDEVLVLNNRGSIVWVGMAKVDGGFVFAASALDPAAVLRMTRDRRAELLRDRCVSRRSRARQDA